MNEMQTEIRQVATGLLNGRINADRAACDLLSIILDPDYATEPEPEPNNTPWLASQRRALFALWGVLCAEMGMSRDDKYARHAMSTAVLGWPVLTWSALTIDQASRLIQGFEQVLRVAEGDV